MSRTGSEGSVARMLSSAIEVPSARPSRPPVAAPSPVAAPKTVPSTSKVPRPDQVTSYVPDGSERPPAPPWRTGRARGRRATRRAAASAGRPSPRAPLALRDPVPGLIRQIGEWHDAVVVVHPTQVGAQVARVWCGWQWQSNPAAAAGRRAPRWPLRGPWRRWRADRRPVDAGRRGANVQGHASGDMTHLPRAVPASRDPPQRDHRNRSPCVMAFPGCHARASVEAGAQDLGPGLRPCGARPAGSGRRAR